MKDLRVLLITTPITEEFNNQIVTAYMDSYRNNPHIGVYLLASILRKSFFVSVLDLVASKDWDKNTVLIACDNIDVVGISGNSMNWATARMIAGWIKHDRPDIILIAGGPHPTMFSKEVLSEGLFDFVVRGEAEEIIGPLIESISLKNLKPDIEGVAWPGKETNIQQISLKTYEQLPEPAWDMLENIDIFQGFPIETARGCKSACGFCAIPYPKSWRPRSPERILYSLQFAQPYSKKTKTQKITVVDDCTTISAERLIQLGKYLENLLWTSKLLIDGRIIDIVKQPNLLETLNLYIDRLLVGAECGYDDGLKRIGKPINIRDILKSAKILSCYGNPSRFVYSFIIGLPWETATQCKQTIEFAENLILSYGITVYLQWYTMLPGSRFWFESGSSETICRRFGYFSDLDWWLTHNKLSLKDIVELCESVFAMVQLNKSIFDDGRFGFSIPMALRKRFPDWSTVSSIANVQ
jgi:radical SAM superfamily enzyme YgiQ (UPF0313 family)